MSPLGIEIGLHYHCIAVGDFPRLDAPACQEMVAWMVEAGLLNPVNGDRRYEPTDGLRVWVEALCAVPFPVRRWILPVRKEGRQAAGGRARAAKLTPERRREIAKEAAEARWSR